MKNLQEIEIDIKIRAKQIDAPEIHLPTFGNNEGNARPNIEIGSNGYNFVISERNVEYKRIATKDYKELLFLIFEAVTFEMACWLELENRIDNQDFRIQLFQIQENLISKIDNEYKERLNLKHKKLLRNVE